MNSTTTISIKHNTPYKNMDTLNYFTKLIHDYLQQINNNSTYLVCVTLILTFKIQSNNISDNCR